MLLESNVVAGKTAVGTKIEAKLCVATLVNGTVIPRNAVFSGEVVESVAKSSNEASRLAIRMDSAQWKNESVAVKVYLSAWYYPTVSGVAAQNLQYGPDQPDKKTWNGMGQYPDPHSPVNKPFPNGVDQNSTAPDASTSATSNHRTQMKNVESEQGSDGAITLVSKKSNIKLDKLTTYVLATGDIAQSAKPATTK